MADDGEFQADRVLCFASGAALVSVLGKVGAAKRGQVTFRQRVSLPLRNSPGNTVLDEVGDQSLIWSSRS